MQVLQVAWIALESHGIVTDGLMKHSYPHVAISSVRIAFTVISIDFNLFGKVFYSFWKFLHFTINETNV